MSEGSSLCPSSGPEGSVLAFDVDFRVQNSLAAALDDDVLSSKCSTSCSHVPQRPTSLNGEGNRNPSD